MKRLLLFLGLVLMTSLSLFSQNAGSLDPTFNPEGTGPNGGITEIITQPDRKILILGEFTSYNEIPRNGLARLNSDGTLDLDYNVDLSYLNRFRILKILPNYRILIEQFQDGFNELSERTFLWLNPDGSVDAVSQLDLGLRSSIRSAGIDNRGRIILLGNFFQKFDADSGDLTYYTILRLKEDLTIDPTFDIENGKGYSDSYHTKLDIAFQNDGKLILVGDFVVYGGALRKGIARVNEDGSLDRSLDPGDGAESPIDVEIGIAKVAIQDDGKILIGGRFESYDGTKIPGFARLNADGSLDEGFQGLDDGYSETVNVKILSDGKILIFGSDFYRGGLEIRNYIWRLNPDGSVDPTFDTGQGPNNEVRTIALQEDGKILIGGTFTGFNNVSRVGIARLLNDQNLEQCEIDVKSKTEVTVKLDKDGKGRLTTEMVDEGSCSTCGPVKLELSKCDFTCSDLGEETVELKVTDAKGNVATSAIKVTVIDELKPNIGIGQQTFTWLIRSGDYFMMPDFRSIIGAADNCSFEVKQSPAPGTIYKKPQDTFINFEVRDPSGNIATAKIRFVLVVFKCNLLGKDLRLLNENGDAVRVPWNTPFEMVLKEGIEYEKGTDPEIIKRISWHAEAYNSLRPGSYEIRATYRNEAFPGMDVSIPVTVTVDTKPLAEDITITRNQLSRNIQMGEIIGQLKTVDPADDIHSYSMGDHPDFYIEKDVLVWKGKGMPDMQLKVVVHSLDRAGQTISREITLEREFFKIEDMLVYPNPTSSVAHIEVMLSEAAEVTIRVIDPLGRLMFEEITGQEGNFARSYDLTGYSAGIYIIQVQDGLRVISKRIVKK